MALTRAERERITDSQLKIQLISDSLEHLDPEKVPDFEEIQNCLKAADRSLSGVLHEGGGQTAAGPKK